MFGGDPVLTMDMVDLVLFPSAHGKIAFFVNEFEK